jgi:predicted lipid-binding transport protein (Tim44 family)
MKKIDNSPLIPLAKKLKPLLPKAQHTTQKKETVGPTIDMPQYPSPFTPKEQKFKQLLHRLKIRELNEIEDTFKSIQDAVHDGDVKRIERLTDNMNKRIESEIRVAESRKHDVDYGKISLKQKLARSPWVQTPKDLFTGTFAGIFRLLGI